MKLIVFDFDGVVADSEMLANGVLAEFLTELGVPTTLEQSMQTFMGKRAEDLIATVAALNPGMPGAQFAAELTRRTLARFALELREVPGIRDYLAAFPTMKRCIASSSSPERLAACLDILDLAPAFGEHVYSASMVPRGKPHPDLFLHAASRLGVAPADAIVIEDSEGGVRAAVAAGMTPIGFCAASHIRDGHEARLRDAGAVHVARSYAEVERITRGLVR
jgi:HAD superfamily hydrolase (TIGR01509 family)